MIGDWCQVANPGVAGLQLLKNEFDMEYKKQEIQFRAYLLEVCLEQADAAHDLSHIERVVSTAKQLTVEEGANLDVVLPAAWLHDCVLLPKNHPERSKASALAADKAVDFLRQSGTGSGYNPDLLEQIHHAIVAHSFSAGITPQTTEAKVVQDADRLDALGAIGIARCMMVGGILGRALYNPDDPFCENRPPDDKKWTVDHFYQKLFRLPDSMQTESGWKEAKKRATVMETFLKDLRREL